MLLRFLPVFISLGYKIDLYLLYNYRMQMDFEFDLGYTSNQIELFSIFPYKTTKSASAMPYSIADTPSYQLLLVYNFIYLFTIIIYDKFLLNFNYV